MGGLPGGRPRDDRGRESGHKSPHPVTMLSEAFGVAGSTFYASGGAPGKRGPKTAVSDDELVEKISQTINESPPGGLPEGPCLHEAPGRP